MHALATNALVALASASAVQAYFSIPVTRTSQPHHVVRPGHVRAAGGNVVVPETDDAAFWFANFGVGSSQSQSLLIDTGSADVYLNPADSTHRSGYYQPGSSAANLHRRFQISFATTNSDGSGTETLSGDLWQDRVSLGGLVSPQQVLGNVTQSNTPTAFPHDGLVGFSGLDSSASGSTPWFHSLCDAGSVPACRFGLAYGTNGTGVQVLGGVDSAYAGSLSTASISDEWITTMGVTANGKTVSSRQTVIFDSGTSVIYGPIARVKQVFAALGIPTAQKGSNPAYLYGYYPCDQPPTVGFVLGGTNFNIVPSVWPAKNNGNNNCTAVLQGTDAFGSQWLVGQAFFQGHYVDHNIDAGTMGFANLK